MWHLAVALHAAFAALCGTLVALFLALVCVPCLHVPVRAFGGGARASFTRRRCWVLHPPTCLAASLPQVRARLRPWTIHHVESGLEWVVAAQRLQTPWLTRLFTQSSHSVSVTFYVSVWWWCVCVGGGGGGGHVCCGALVGTSRALWGRRRRAARMQAGVLLCCSAALLLSSAAPPSHTLPLPSCTPRLPACPPAPPLPSPAPPRQASFLPILFWLGLPELGRNLVFLVGWGGCPVEGGGDGGVMSRGVLPRGVLPRGVLQMLRLAVHDAALCSPRACALRCPWPCTSATR